MKNKKRLFYVIIWMVLFPGFLISGQRQDGKGMMEWTPKSSTDRILVRYKSGMASGILPIRCGS